MLIKWVSCTVTDRNAFAAGQAGWGALRGLPGFLGQAGGWSRHTPGRAQIFGFWRDHAAYQAFMSGPHDRIAAGQAGAYDTIQVRIFDALQDAGRPLPPGFAEASLVRLTHCQAQNHHFVRAQQAVWSAAPGLAGGVLARHAPDEYLVLTAWRSAPDHDVRDSFPDLRRRSGTVADLTTIDGDQITLDPTWTVPAS